MPTLTIDKKVYEVKRLGNGAFSRVYKTIEGDKVFALTADDNGDFSKEAVAMWTGENPHIPQIECENTPRLSSIYGNFYCYSMPVYTMRKTGLPRQQMTAIIKSWQSFLTFDLLRSSKKSNYEICIDWLESVKNDFPELLVEAMLDILDATSNYGDDYLFDFSSANFAQNGDTLILLDIVFSASARQGINS